MRYIGWYRAALMGALSVSQNPVGIFPSVLGAWRVIGTAPPGVVRHGAEVARLTLTLQRGRRRALVLTGPHRYTASGQYSAARHQLLLTVHTAKGLVRLQATPGPGSARMIGTWSDTRGDDGGFVLLRLAAHPGAHRH